MMRATSAAIKPAQDDNVIDISNRFSPRQGDEGALYRDDEDGGMTVLLGAGLGGGLNAREEDVKGAPFNANLAEYLDESTLNTIAYDVIEGIEADLESRKEWEELLRKGMELLGFKMEERDYPFKGAAGVFHPVMTEAVVRFQAQARGEMLPAAGPVRTQIIGDDTPDVEMKANRVKDFFNYWCTEENENYYPEFDKMLMQVGIVGNAFKKVFHNPLKNGPDAPFILPDRLIVNYGATSLEDAARITQVIPTSKTELIRKQLMKVYRKIDLGEPIDDELSEPQKVRDKIEGRSDERAEGEESYIVYESHTEYDIEIDGLEHCDEEGEPTGLPLPYIITLDRDTRKVLAIYRNWDQQDAHYATGPKRSQFFVHYGLLPGTGFYYFGYAHILGGIAKGSTMLLRQLLDSGTLANFPGGLRVKGMKTDDSSVVVGPCEFKEIDTGGLPIQDSVMPLPYKDPSAVLLQLLTALTEAAQRLGATADMQVGEGRQDAPVGTTIAMIEQAQKVMSAIHKRLHVSQRKELRLLAKVFGREEGAKYPYRVNGQTGMALGADFNSAIVDVLPVTDPNIPTQAQRLALLDAELKLAQSAPQIHDLRAIYGKFYLSLGLQQAEIAQIMPPPNQGMPADPITEFQMALKGQPLMAGPMQNHDAHIAAHMSQLQIPHIDKTPAFQPMLSHIYDHTALKYRQAMAVQLAQQGIQVPPPSPPGAPPQPMPPQMEQQLSIAVAGAAKQVLSQFQQSMDPAMALENRTLDLKQFELQLKKQDQDRKAVENEAMQKTELQKLEATMANDAKDRASRERQGEQKIEAERVRAVGELGQAGLQAISEAQDMQHQTHRTQVDAATQVHSDRHETHRAHLAAITDFMGAAAQHQANTIDNKRAANEGRQVDVAQKQVELDRDRLPIEKLQAQNAGIAARRPTPSKK